MESSDPSPTQNRANHGLRDGEGKPSPSAHPAGRCARCSGSFVPVANRWEGVSGFGASAAEHLLQNVWKGRFAGATLSSTYRTPHGRSPPGIIPRYERSPHTISLRQGIRSPSSPNLWVIAPFTPPRPTTCGSVLPRYWIAYGFHGSYKGSNA